MNTKANNMGDSTTLTVRLDSSVKERLGQLAGRMNRSKSFLAGAAIEEFLAVQEWQIEGIHKAIHSLDEGKAVPHDDVVNWVKSWGSDNELAKPTT